MFDKKEKDLSGFSFKMMILNIIGFIFILVIFVIIFYFSVDTNNVGMMIFSSLFLIPLAALGFSILIIRKRMDGFKEYYCEKCGKNFTAVKPDRDDKSAYCYRYGTKIDTPKHFIKGRIFEEKVKERFERSEGFKVISETPRYEDKNTHAKKYPDLRIQYYNSDKFFVEVKYRENGTNKKLRDIITKDTQLKRFKNFKKEFGEQVYYYIGLDGSPEEPENVFVVPIDHLITHLKNDRDIEFLEKKHYGINFKKNAFYKNGRLS